MPASPGPTDFGGKLDVPFVAGSLYGLRAFGIEDDGLHSVSMRDYLWKPGEMVASCYHTFDYWDANYFDAQPKRHQVASGRCRCGFYSYHQVPEAKSYHPEDGIMGVIEAYGHVTLGNKGMRSEKARIVGLVVPRNIFGRVLHGRHKAALARFPEVRTFLTVPGAARAFGVFGKPQVLS
jgi:hypothetical protein